MSVSPVYPHRVTLHPGTPATSPTAEVMKPRVERSMLVRGWRQEDIVGPEIYVVKPKSKS